MIKNQIVSFLTNTQPIPSVYNEGFSQYETILKLIELTNKLINDMNTGSDEIEDLAQKQADISLLKDELDKIAKGDYVPLYLGALSSWINDNLNTLVDDIAQFASFGLDDDGYFVAFVPESWNDIEFGTSENGELLLNY